MGQMIMCTLAELGWKLRWADNFFCRTTYKLSTYNGNSRD
jgi:hypothetical protein